MTVNCGACLLRGTTCVNHSCDTTCVSTALGPAICPL
jgi:hypothetical protein